MPTYKIDPVHSEVAFVVRHMMFAKVRGQFRSWTAELDYDASEPKKSSVLVEVDTASIDTRDEQRDGHLKSGDFFDAETFPKMTFKSKSVQPVGQEKYQLTGALSIRGTTHDVTLDVEQTGSGKDPWGNERLGFSVKGSINRGDWGLKWNQALEAGGVLVSDKVDIDAELEVIQGQ